MLSTIERRQEIVMLTERLGKVSVKDLAEQFDISTVSIRHDLNELNNLGLVVRSRGGALASNRLTKELSIKEKHKSNHATKQLIGKAVADLINDGESFILDSGSTTEEVIPYLTTKKNLTVMTNGLNIANQLSHIPDCEVLVAGGSLRRKSLSFHGADAIKQLENYNFSKVILGVDGIDAKCGITTHFEPEANVNKAMCNSAQTVIAVTDSSKFNKYSLYSILPLDKIDIIITDSGIPQEYIDIFKSLDIKLQIVDT